MSAPWEGSAAESGDLRRLVSEGWESFKDQAIPDGAGAAQCEEMRLAFYRGASHVLQELIKMPPGETRSGVTYMLGELSSWVTEMLVESAEKALTDAAIRASGGTHGRSS